ncbi:universal stress protein [Haladaptatus sp. T7]|uniref:universal stress protein n=1 Tax=Haladaptatus sp. T7 TaxID=2029368 RepID=UPI0022322A11|nr:universal stress protein [Haladaptatus sp. T7]
MVIVAAIDRTERATDVLAEATILAEKFEEEVHVLHVMKRSEAIQIEEDSTNKDEAVSTAELREQAAQPAKSLVDTNPTGVGTTTVGRIGDPASEIVEYADDHQARYVVISPRRRSQTGKLLFGSVAQTVLLNASCPVVSLADQS